MYNAKLKNNNLIQTRVVTDREEIGKLIPNCLELAKRAQCKLPSQYMYMPLIWWDHFHADGGAEFSQMRGTNFFGAQSYLEDLYLVLTEKENTLAGATLLAGYKVKLPGKKDYIRILAWPGDYQLISFQDFVVLPSIRAEIIPQLVASIINISFSYDMLLLQYIPENSLNLPFIRMSIKDLASDKITSLERTTGRRGGIRPWTLAPLLQSCHKLSEDLSSHPSMRKDIENFTEELGHCSPMKLLFPATRSKFEKRMIGILSAMQDRQEISDETKKIQFLLTDQPIIYPHIQLPNDRDTYLMTLSRSTRRYFRRYRQQFEQRGGRFEKISGKEIRAGDIDDYLNLHGIRWEGNSASLSSEQTYAFHRNLCRSMAASEEFSLFFAKYQERRIAAHSCIDISDRREGYITGRDADYDHLRASRLLYMETILDAIDGEFRTYELGQGWFAYKMSFTKTYGHSFNFILQHHSAPIKIENLFLGYEYMADQGKRLEELPS